MKTWTFLRRMVFRFGRGSVWLDTGTHDSLIEASNYIQTIEKRQGLKVGSPEEISWRMKFINDEQLLALAKPLAKTDYGLYLQDLVKEQNGPYSQSSSKQTGLP